MRERVLAVSTDGTINRVLFIPPEMVASNALEGEIMMQMVGDEGGFVDDAHVIVNEAGSLAPKTGAPEGISPPPSLTLELIAL